MAGFMKFLGGLLIAIGLLGGLGFATSADWKDYREARELYKTLPTNQFAIADYQAARLAFWPSITTAIAVAGSGIVGGAVLLGLGEGLSLLGAMALQMGAGKAEARRSFSTAWPAAPED